MPRARNAKADEALALYRQGLRLVDIAKKLEIPEGTVRRWKCTYKWDSDKSERSESKKSVRKRGGQPGNRNRAAPKGNKRAEKFGFFSKYLPEETREIFDAIDEADPLDLLWDQIRLSYTAIIRAQSILNISPLILFSPSSSLFLCSASGYMERNLYSLNVLPFLPTRS